MFFVDILPPWEMYFDGGATTEVVLIFLKSRFSLTHLHSKNIGEYQAVILGLLMATGMESRISMSMVTHNWSSISI